MFLSSFRSGLGLAWSDLVKCMPFPAFAGSISESFECVEMFGIKDVVGTLVVGV